jgi:glycerophosphoryl diester phosphodiesterase
MVEQNKLKGRWKSNLHYLLALIILVHCLFFFIYWISVGNFRLDVDQFMINAVNWRLPYTGILIGLAMLIGVWSFIRFLRFRLTSDKDAWKPSTINWIYFVVAILFLVIFYLSFIIILRENPSQWGVLYQLFNLTRLVGDIFVFVLAAVWLRKLILFFRRKSAEAELSWPWTAGIIFALILLVSVWLVPALFPPNWAYQGNLPPKPALLAHRGASMIAPENTLAAAELAADYQAFGFESDVKISLDGIPFLMHDETLARTTNIAEVFPTRVNDRAESFTMDELKQLNAGLWFIQKDPYETIDKGLVSQSQLSINQGQEIPTLGEALALVKDKDLVFLFDMRYPAEDHPYYDEFFEIVLTQCRESGLNGNIWFLVEQDRLSTVIEDAPQVTRVKGISSTDLVDAATLADQQYEIVNVDTGIRFRDIQDYRSRGLGVNVYTIDQSWLFSQFWLSGVTSVTTNNVHTFSELDQPNLNIPYSRYLLIWGLLGIVVAIWLASSQPPNRSEKPKMMVTPDLLDFASEEDEVLLQMAVPTGDESSEEGIGQALDGGVTSREDSEISMNEDHAEGTGEKDSIKALESADADGSPSAETQDTLLEGDIDEES